MRRSHLDFAMLSEGRLETIDALFEMEQLSRACASEWESDPGARETTDNSEGRIGSVIASIFNVIKRCLNFRKYRAGNQRGNDGNTKTRKGIVT